MIGTQDFLDDMRLVPASTPEVGIIPTERERALQAATEALAVVVPEERTFDNLLDLAEFLLEEEPEEEVVALNTLQGTVRTVINQHINNPPATTPEETVARIDSELLSQHMSELHDRVGEEVLGDEPADLHPTQLDTEDEYEAAPVGTRAKSYYTWEKTEDGTWIALEAGGAYRPTNAQLAADCDPRPVVRWGAAA